MTADPTGANNVVAAGANAHGARSLKAKAADEFRRFLVLFFYLWILFGVFVLNQGVVLREHGINFAMQGFAFFNALVFAKVVMLFEVFDPGRWLRKRPLIYPILYESVLLTVLFLIAHVLEKTIEGLIRGKRRLRACHCSPALACRGFSASPSSCLSRRSRFLASGI